jgi:hypothetical protein
MRCDGVVLEVAPRFVDVGNGEGHDRNARHGGKNDVLEPCYDLVDARNLDRALVELESKLSLFALAKR